MAARGLTIACAAALATVAVPAGAQVLGPDAAACNGGEGPAIRATITGLKDAQGTLKLELYPATEEDFLAGDDELAARGRRTEGSALGGVLGAAIGAASLALIATGAAAKPATSSIEVGKTLTVAVTGRI
ncbi:hypothetical protein LTR94_031757, partial [Friedmanniomyces endolithicus]